MSTRFYYELSLGLYTRVLEKDSLNKEFRKKVQENYDYVMKELDELKNKDEEEKEEKNDDEDEKKQQ
jgi:hypothetical protein